MISQFLAWRDLALREEDGVLVGTDLSQEWLLPWWWENYRRHNSHPVAFVDFGMSYEKKEWCRKRGEWIPLRLLTDFVKEKEKIPTKKIRQWEKETGNDFWDFRSAWFKKPFACLQTPFQRSLWIDLDCEVKGGIQPLFDFADGPEGLAMRPEFPTGYNSGVICFRRNLAAIIEWGRACIKQNGSFRGDQEVFSHVIAEKKIPITNLPHLYNWSRISTDNPEALILHWHGRFGKFIIRQKMIFEELSL